MSRLILPGALARSLVKAPPAPRVPFRAVVASASGGLVTVTPVGSDTAGALTLARLAGFAVAVGDEVLIEPAGTGWIVAGTVQRSAPSGYALDAPLTVPSLNTPLHWRKSQTAADTASTTNTTTFVDLIAQNITLPAGTWTVRVEGGANLAHSASQSVDRRAVLGASNGATAVATMQTTRERYPIDDVFTGIAGSQTLTARLQFKGSAGTSGTSSARCPEVDIWAERTS